MGNTWWNLIFGNNINRPTGKCKRMQSPPSSIATSASKDLRNRGCAPLVARLLARDASDNGLRTEGPNARTAARQCPSIISQNANDSSAMCVICWRQWTATKKSNKNAKSTKFKWPITVKYVKYLYVLIAECSGTRYCLVVIVAPWAQHNPLEKNIPVLQEQDLERTGAIWSKNRKFQKKWLSNQIGNAKTRYPDRAEEELYRRVFPGHHRAPGGGVQGKTGEGDWKILSQF